MALYITNMVHIPTRQDQPRYPPSKPRIQKNTKNQDTDVPGIKILGPMTKPPRRFHIFHRNRCREENEGGGLGRNAIFAGQPRPDVMMRVGVGHGSGVFQ